MSMWTVHKMTKRVYAVCVGTDSSTATQSELQYAGFSP